MSTEESLVLAEEQAALRRLATLVAGGAPSEEVFAAVTMEIGRLLPVDYAALSRFEFDRTLTYVGAWSAIGKPFPPVGTRVNIEGNNVSSLVFETRRPALMRDRHIHDHQSPLPRDRLPHGRPDRQRRGGGRDAEHACRTTHDHAGGGPSRAS